jgi:hypothetical protein
MKLEAAVLKKMKQIPGSGRLVGSNKIRRMEGVLGMWSQALLRLYALWQVQFQECVNDSYDVRPSFVYIPYSHNYIQHIKCREGN